MSTAAILWTHNERDVLEPNLRHLLTQVDEIFILDRSSNEETRAMIQDLARSSDMIRLDWDDGRHKFNQSAVMTEIAQWAYKAGHEWAVPVDPDEIWYVPDTTLKEFFLGLAKDVGRVTADLYNHVATVEDKHKGTPFERITWRQTHPLHLPKMAGRLRPDLVVMGGNHTMKVSGVALIVGGLLVRHFPYRTQDQFVEKVRSNYTELKKAHLPDGYGIHIRAYGKCLEEEGEPVLRAHFDNWFLSKNPREDDTLIQDPAPVQRWEP